MHLFAVRMIADQQPVGFFWVRDLAQLWELVDTITIPKQCECREVTNATAIIWEGRERWRMGARDGPLANASAFEDRMAQVKAGLSFDDDWDLSLMRFVDGDNEIEGWEEIPEPW